MHLVPKEAGKGLGLSWEVLLWKCNEQCQQYGLLDYREQVGKVDSEGDQLTQTMDDEPAAPPKKWRVCQAFHAVNAVMQIPAFPSGDPKTKKQQVSREVLGQCDQLSSRLLCD